MSETLGLDSRQLRRLLIAGLVVLLLHLIFFFGIAPYLQLEHPQHTRTEVSQISPSQLAELKKKILKKHLSPLLKQELHEEYKTKDVPKDAEMMAPFNQSVPKQTVAGAQHDEPLDGGGGAAAAKKSKAEARPQLKLDKLGLGNKIPKPLPQTVPSPTKDRESATARQGPPGPYRPRGFDAKDIEKGEDNLLNAAQSEYYAFFERFTEPFIRNWIFLVRSNTAQIGRELARKNAKVGMEFPVTIEFEIDRQGNFLSIAVVESSGLPTFDASARQAMQKLGALPNPPPGLFEGKDVYTHAIRVTLVNNESSLDRGPNIDW